MPGPSATTFQRPDLGILFEQFDTIAAREGFIAQRVLPFFPVALQSAPFPKVKLESVLRDVKTRRAPGAPYNRVSGEFEQDSYATEEHGLEELLDDRERRMYAQSLDLGMIASQRIAIQLATEAEKRAAALLFNASTWTGAALTTGVSTEWSTVSTATPMADVAAAISKVRLGTSGAGGAGINPMTLVGICDWTVFNNLRRCAEIKSEMKYAGIDDPLMPWADAAAVIAKALGLRDLIVAGGVKNAAHRGLSRSLESIWDDEYFMVAKIADGNDLRRPCVGRTFVWEGDGAAAAGTFEEYREDQTRSQVFRARHDVLEKVLYVEAAHLLSNITA